MAHFAELDENNIVIRVCAVPDEQQHRGQEFLADDLNMGGHWIETSATNQIRKQYAGIGYTYDPEADVFIALQPYPSWVLDTNHDWQAPTPMPTEGRWYWNEDSLEWVEVV